MAVAARFSVAVFIFSATATVVQAAPANAQDCWTQAGLRYNVNPKLLYAIAKHESSLNPRAYENLGTSESRGLMQINSFWYPKLSEMGITSEDLWEPCTNIHVGAWILSQEIQRYGNTWTAVGAYNAGAHGNLTGKRLNDKIEKYSAYAKRVYEQLR